MVAPLLLLLACASAPTRLDRPNAVVLGTDGRLYVSDFHHQRVVVFSAEGRFLRTFGHQGLGRGELWAVEAMEQLGPDRLALADQRVRAAGEDQSYVEVREFSLDGRPQGAHPLWAPRNPGSQEEGPTPPEGLPANYLALRAVEAMAPDGAGGAWVANSGGDALLRFDRDWVHQETLKQPLGGEALRSPAGLRRVGDELWVVEQFEHRVRRLDPEGRQLAVFGEEGDRPGQLRFPGSVDGCPGQWVVVADLGNHRVQRFDLEGNFIGGFEPQPAGFHTPVQLVSVRVTPDCEGLVLVDSMGGRVLLTDPDGRPRGTLAAW